MPDPTAVTLAGVVVPVGTAQGAVAAGLISSYESLPAYMLELQRRRDVLPRRPLGLSVEVPEGGWSLLLRGVYFGLTGNEMPERLLKEGICATWINDWGPVHGSQYIRFVFANRCAERSEGCGAKVKRSIGVGA